MMTYTSCNTYRYLLAIVATLALSVFAAADWSPEAIARATGWEVTGRDRAIVDGREVSFEIAESTEFTVDGQPWETAILRFPGQEMNAETLKTVTNGAPCQYTMPPRVVVQRADGQKALGAVLDQDAVALLSVEEILFGDFVGSGSELSIVANLSFCESPTRRTVEAKRRYVFTFPDLVPLAAIDDTLIVKTSAGETKIQHWLYPMYLADQSPAIAVQRAGDLKQRIISYRVPAYERILGVNPDAPGATPYPARDTEPTTLKARLLDEKGKPMSGIRINYQYSHVPPLVIGSTFIEGNVYTDDNGYFETPTGQRLAISTEVDGYYNLVLDFHRSEYNGTPGFEGSEPFPHAVIDIRMAREQAEVEVWDTFDFIRKEYLSPDDDYTFAIKFYPDRIENKNNPLDVDVLADVVFDLHRMCDDEEESTEQKVCAWSVSVRGQNGWELVPGEPDSDRFNVRQAPESGYRTEWQFAASQLPEMLYLRKDSGNRYGLLDWVQVIEMPGNLSLLADNTLKVICGYVVQAHPQGTRSLVHQRKRGAFTYD